MSISSQGDNTRQRGYDALLKKSLTLPEVRRYAVGRTLFVPTTLARAIKRLGFVQADPIRAPARAQDLTLRHRVRNYRAGDLERLYPKLAIEEDFFVNYGFLPRATHALMHPRATRPKWSKSRQNRAEALLEFVRAKGTVHPREVDAHFPTWKGAQLVWRIDKRQHAIARPDALPGPGPDRQSRRRHAPLLRARANTVTGKHT